ncbi:hypothetical protein C9J12_21085 [Photobacterium frigidiphilum]|uniref:Uncharacterized protein n=1 Tax=Photobacterium frigidiphilum TaxID=264736 RepID=A0A2T3JA66_9GAMM|nr:hypothetical protein [Photobacterium frigidiphilum]PSU45740.1 hypothetical protein C9J12_21085 [Photobacterium frigidiphilum]
MITFLKKWHTAFTEDKMQKNKLENMKKGEPDHIRNFAVSVLNGQKKAAEMHEDIHQSSHRYGHFD